MTLYVSVILDRKMPPNDYLKSDFFFNVNIWLTNIHLTKNSLSAQQVPMYLQNIT